MAKGMYMQNASRVSRQCGVSTTERKKKGPFITRWGPYKGKEGMGGKGKKKISQNRRASLGDRMEGKS